MRTSLCVLGCLNDRDGTLSAISSSRIELAVNIYHDFVALGHECVILATGGFGAHFNDTGRPHNHYAKEYLLQLGVHDSNIVIEELESSNTVEDAIFCKRHIDKSAASSTTVITSNYHLARTAMIFNAIFGGSKLNFQSARDCQNIPDNLYKHELAAIFDLIERGYVYYGSDKFYI